MTQNELEQPSLFGDDTMRDMACLETYYYVYYKGDDGIPMIYWRRETVSGGGSKYRFMPQDESWPFAETGRKVRMYVNRIGAQMSLNNLKRNFPDVEFHVGVHEDWYTPPF